MDLINDYFVCCQMEFVSDIFEIVGALIVHSEAMCARTHTNGLQKFN